MVVAIPKPVRNTVNRATTKKIKDNYLALWN